jgi:hypothetical protein
LDDNKEGPKGPGSDPTKTSGDPNGSITGKGVFGGGGGGNGGSGYEWTFSRPMKKLPELSDQITVHASIDVDIVVDKTGKVISAIPNEKSIRNQKGANSVSEIVRLAKKAALSAKFEEDPNGGASKAGKITINFKLK